MKTETEQLMDETKEIIQRFVHDVEPKLWDHRAEALELVKQVGYLSQCVLLNRGYKLGKAGNNDFMNECSDILYMIFRICNSFGLSLTRSALLDYGTTDCSMSVEQIMSILAGDTGRVAYLLNYLNDGTEISEGSVQELLESLERLIPHLNFLAKQYGFLLANAYRRELRKTRAWFKVRELRRSSLFRRIFFVIAEISREAHFDH